MELDFTPLQRAITQLEKSLKFATSPEAEANSDLFEQLRNSVIQCFEFTYELSHKMLKRYLKEQSASPDDIELSTFANLIRTGNEKKLLRSDWSRWKVYRQARTNSSHTYDEDKAIAVYQIVPEFLEEAQFLFQQFVSKHGHLV